MLLHDGHDRLRSSTMRVPTNWVDVIADSAASGQIGGGVRYTLATSPRILEVRDKRRARRMSGDIASA